MTESSWFFVWFRFQVAEKQDLETSKPVLWTNITQSSSCIAEFNIFFCRSLSLSSLSLNFSLCRSLCLFLFPSPPLSLTFFLCLHSPHTFSIVFRAVTLTGQVHETKGKNASGEVVSDVVVSSMFLWICQGASFPKIILSEHTQPILNIASMQVSFVFL